MPKPRKSLSQLAESGTLHKNSGRYAGRAAAAIAPVRPIGKAPTHLPPAERIIWAELVRVSQPGVLQRSDRFFLELCCRMIARMRTADSKPSEYNSLANILAKLGMNPADRAKLDLPPVSPTEKSAWDELDELD
jgi:phage terminase small subunit